MTEASTGECIYVPECNGVQHVTHYYQWKTFCCKQTDSFYKYQPLIRPTSYTTGWCPGSEGPRLWRQIKLMPLRFVFTLCSFPFAAIQLHDYKHSYTITIKFGLNYLDQWTLAALRHPFFYFQANLLVPRQRSFQNKVQFTCQKLTIMISPTWPEGAIFCMIAY